MARGLNHWPGEKPALAAAAAATASTDAATADAVTFVAHADPATADAITACLAKHQANIGRAVEILAAMRRVAASEALLPGAL